MNQKIYQRFPSAGFTVLTLLCCFFFSHTVEAQQGLAPEQVAEIITVTSATISDDGTYVAYTVSKPADPKEVNRSNQTHLYLLNTQTGESRPYYSRSGIGDIAFRPEHNSITILTSQDGDETRSLYELPIHGSEDTRVHPGQSLELYRHLKVRRPDVPVRLVFYPDEGHGNVNSSSRYDYTLRMFRWFDTYLMSGDANADIPDWEVALPKSDEEKFFNVLASHCGATFTGEGVYPDDPDHELIDIPLVARIESCTEDEIRIPFHAGDDRSRTWIISKTDRGLLLKHDHRDPETGEKHDLTNYGGYATSDGTAFRQFFAADEETIDMLPEAATNVWMMEIDPETGEFTYYLERHQAPRYRAELEME